MTRSGSLTLSAMVSLSFRREYPHPVHEVLLRFARGDVSMAERKAVVAHLLGRCETCAARIREAAGFSAPIGRSPLTAGPWGDPRD
jgi:hypothetical protein